MPFMVKHSYMVQLNLDFEKQKQKQMRMRSDYLRLSKAGEMSSLSH